MAIWQYADVVRDEGAVKLAMTLAICPFCSSELELLRDEKKDIGRSGEYETTEYQSWVCPTCGWWKCRSSFRHTDFGFRVRRESGAAASLRALDLSDLSLPIEEVRSYLSAKYDQRFDLHPRLFELVVESVFKDHDYEAEATAYTNDGGIDVVLRKATGEQIGVQVKRYKDSIEVEQIRSFAGTLFLNGYTRGIFITTSRFQKGGYGEAEKSALRGIPIELWDASKFLDALRIGQREMYQSTYDLRSYIEPSAFVTLSSNDYRRRF